MKRYQSRFFFGLLPSLVALLAGVFSGVATAAFAQGGPPLAASEVFDGANLPPAPRTRDNGTPTTAAGWRGRAERLRDANNFAGASRAYFEAANRYRALGDVQTAKVMTTLGQRYETRLRLFYDRPADRASLQGNYLGKRLEPLYGAYLGAFIDREDGLNHTFTGENGQTHGDSAEFNARVGKRHAIFFMYNEYGRPFPDKWFAHLRKNGAAAQWVLQPRRLNDVQDDNYLRGLARSVARSGVPVFVRFAGEMNGGWVPYHGDPETYKEKFRLVARVFHRYAPNAAMVWCPNEIPEAQIPAYYPGSEAVDWVGVNFYSVLYNDNSLSRPVGWRNPADALDYIYRTYSDRHPILIGEYGATHESSLDSTARPDFAAAKFAELYAALPRRYPRVKAVHYFSMNAIRYADEGRRFNNYSLLDRDVPQVSQAYSALVRSPYFLEQVRQGAIASTETTALTEGTVLRGKVSLSFYAKTYEQRPRIAVTTNGRVLHTVTTPGNTMFAFDTRAIPDGPTTIMLTVNDGAGRIAGRQSVTVRIANGNNPAPKPKPSPTPPPKPEPNPAPTTTTLLKMLTVATANTDAVRLQVSPDHSPLLLGQYLRFTIKVKRSGYLVLLSDDPDGTCNLLFPRNTQEASAAFVSVGQSVSIPQAANRGLSPDLPGRYQLRAYLLPNQEAAENFLQIFAARKGTLPIRTAKTLFARQRVPSGRAAISERRIDIISPKPMQSSNR